MRTALTLALIIAAYALLVLAAIVTLPLRIPEILRLLAASHYSFDTFIHWVVQTPGSAPLHYFVQLPFVLAGDHSRLAARLPSLLFAVGSCFLFWHLTKRLSLRWPTLALLAFILVPVHYRAAGEGTPLEQGLFFLLLATICYFRLIRAPNLGNAALYAGVLVLCLYSERSSYWPAIGYLLFLFGFLKSAHERRAMWFALPATALPVLLYVPYHLWARPQVNPDWLFEPTNYHGQPIYLPALKSLATEGPWGYALPCLLLLGLLLGIWASFRLKPTARSKRIMLFCLLGGIVSAISIVVVIDIWSGSPLTASQVLWATPEMVILFFAGLEWLAVERKIPFLSPALAVVLVLLCLVGDARYLSTRGEDLEAEAALIAPELTNRSCVVFVSERLSKPMFVLFQPDLDQRECLDFFHPRVVLASHPYVQPDQQEDAESYFRGLNFTETKRIRVGGGEIVVMDQAK